MLTMNRCRKAARKLQMRWRRARFPISQLQLECALEELIPQQPACLLVHSSLSALGQFERGADSVIDALRKKCGTLCMPTHTYCYPSNPSEPGPVFDPRVSPSLVGRITNVFWQQSGVLRSGSPSHSLAASGSEAKDLCSGHEKCETPCGFATPYRKLVEMRSAVLMFGVSLNCYTLFHTAEDMAGCNYLYEDVPYRLRVADFRGRLQEVPMWRQNMKVERSFENKDVDLEKAGLLHRLHFGMGQLLFIPDTSKVHQFLLKKLRSRPEYLRAN